MSEEPILGKPLPLTNRQRMAKMMGFFAQEDNQNMALAIAVVSVLVGYLLGKVI